MKTTLKTYFTVSGQSIHCQLIIKWCVQSTGYE